MRIAACQLYLNNKNKWYFSWNEKLALKLDQRCNLSFRNMTSQRTQHLSSDKEGGNMFFHSMTLRFDHYTCNTYPGVKCKMTCSGRTYVT